SLFSASIIFCMAASCSWPKPFSASPFSFFLVSGTLHKGAQLCFAAEECFHKHASRMFIHPKSCKAAFECEWTRSLPDSKVSISISKWLFKNRTDQEPGGT